LRLFDALFIGYLLFHYCLTGQFTGFFEKFSYELNWLRKAVAIINKNRGQSVFPAETVKQHMLIIIHLVCLVLTIVGFVGRIVLAETQPSLLKKKRFKIVPYSIDSLFLLSGIILVVQGHWVSGEHVWLFAKLTALFGYIGFGIVALKIRGNIRWLAFVSAISCFAYIVIVAVTKNALFFL